MPDIFLLMNCLSFTVQRSKTGWMIPVVASTVTVFMAASCIVTSIICFIMRQRNKRKKYLTTN